MKTEETINIVCEELGVTKARLAKKMGMLPSSLYRKLARESMTFEELQQCLDVLGVDIEFDLKFPDGHMRSSKENYELLLKRLDLLETELQAARKSSEINRKSLKELRTDLNSVAGYAELGTTHGMEPEECLNKIHEVFQDMGVKLSYALGDTYWEDANDSVDISMLRGKRVLLVDDNEMNREIMREMLLAQGLVIEEAENGSNAVDAVKAHPAGYYDFVLMDIEMPVMDGYKSTMRIRKLPNRIRANVPIIALTADSYPQTRDQALGVGMDDFIVKPVNTAMVLRCLARYL